MKNKILLPIISACTLIPAIITSVSCNNPTVTENSVIDAIFNPLDIKDTVAIDDFKTEFDKLGESDKLSDLIYGTFGIFNNNIGEETQTINIRDLYKNEGAFKVNITKYSIKKENNEYYGTLLGYVSYVFEKEHKVKIQGTEVTYKANDYIMYTYDIVDAKLEIGNDFSISWVPKYSFADVAILKTRFNGGQDETIQGIRYFSTANLKVKNSHNWIKKITG